MIFDNMLKTIGGANNELLGATGAAAKSQVKEEAAKGPSMIVIVSLMVLISAGMAFAMVRWQVEGRLAFLEDARKTTANDVDGLRESLAGQTSASVNVAGWEEMKAKVDGLELSLATSSAVIASNTLSIEELRSRPIAEVAGQSDQSQVVTPAEPVVGETEATAPAAPVDKLCTDLAKTVSGRTRMPIAAKYGNLDILGQILTAADCGSMRLAQITWLEDSPKGGLQYSFGLTLNLKNPASPELLAQLLMLGFDCETKSMFAACRNWVANKVLTVAELQKLQPFVSEMDTDSSLR
jgi:hypothetical protein